MNPLTQVRIVLVSPKTGGNIGSICRVMMNMGLTDLALVAPPDTLDWNEAHRLACHAEPLLKTCTFFQTLEEAVADCTVVAGASARTGMYRDHATLPREIAPIVIESATHHPTALVFGREDKGLFNEELAICTHIINIPSSKTYRSLNLSHAVMVCAYELFMLARSSSYEPPRERSSEANGATRKRLFDFWSQMMLETGFCEPEKLDHMMLGLRRIFSRGKLTENDARILLGIARQSCWVAREEKQRTVENKKLEHLATQDGLTRLYNRRKMDELLASEISRAKRYDRALSAILFDIDHFKTVNDAQGHAVGDEVLVETARKIRADLRKSDLLGRWGGEEFLILCPETELNTAMQLAERLRQAYETYNLLGAEGLTLSFGVATYHKEQISKDLLIQADDALYRAKNSGRNRVEQERLGASGPD